MRSEIIEKFLTQNREILTILLVALLQMVSVIVTTFIEHLLVAWHRTWLLAQDLVPGTGFTWITSFNNTLAL